jgi:hypothetical protein
MAKPPTAPVKLLPLQNQINDQVACRTRENHVASIPERLTEAGNTHVVAFTLFRSAGRRAVRLPQLRYAAIETKFVLTQES